MNKGKNISLIYRDFAEAEGSQHIASEYAIKKLYRLIKKFNCRSVLEMGLGIGSISGTLLFLYRNDETFKYDGTEANEFCLKALGVNLGRDYNRLGIFRDLEEIPGQNKYDLIIIDGKDEDLEILSTLVSENGILVIEGDRNPQQVFLQKLFPKNWFCHCISVSKNPRYSPFPEGNWQGGLKVFFPNPTLAHKFWCWKEKILTKLKYRLIRRNLTGFINN